MAAEKGVADNLSGAQLRCPIKGASEVAMDVKPVVKLCSRICLTLSYDSTTPLHLRRAFKLCSVGYYGLGFALLLDELALFLHHVSPVLDAIPV